MLAWSAVAVISVGSVFEKTDISQGSVETVLRCGGICSFIANFVPTAAVKGFRKSFSI